MVNGVNFISMMREGMLSVRLWKDGSFQKDSWCRVKIVGVLVVRPEIMGDKNTAGACREVELGRTRFLGALFL